MEPGITKSPAQATYWKIDNALLRLLAVELGYFFLLILLGGVLGVVSLLSADRSAFAPFPTSIFIYAPLPLLYLGNLACGLWGIILNLRERIQGYPGSGHLLNWIFIMSTSWLFLLFVTVVLPTSSRGFID